MPEPTDAPDFLVVGAQKSGTTTLWEDLRTHPDLALSEKESNGLLDPDVLSTPGRRQYRALFDSNKGQQRGEVCTTYTMLPDNPEVVARANALNPNLHVIYIVREPLARVISHHHHDYGLGLCGPDIDVEIDQHTALIENTRYGTQLTPWVNVFGRERVLVVRFEDYIRDRETWLARIHDHLGVPHVPLPSYDVHNASEGKRVVTGTWAAISESWPYRRLVRPYLPEALRRQLMSTVIPAGPPRPAAPSEHTLTMLVSALQPEVDLLAHVTGQGPLWDLDAERAKRILAQ